MGRGTGWPGSRGEGGGNACRMVLGCEEVVGRSPIERPLFLRSGGQIENRSGPVRNVFANRKRRSGPRRRRIDHVHSVPCLLNHEVVDHVPVWQHCLGPYPAPPPLQVLRPQCSALASASTSHKPSYSARNRSPAGPSASSAKPSSRMRALKG